MIYASDRRRDGYAHTGPDPDAHRCSGRSQFAQIKANQLYTETVETLRLRYPDVKP
jgi:hypothetical protein